MLERGLTKGNQGNEGSEPLNTRITRKGPKGKAEILKYEN
jgi:hypothetical protein